MLHIEWTAVRDNDIWVSRRKTEKDNSKHDVVHQACITDVDIGLIEEGTQDDCTPEVTGRQALELADDADVNAALAYRCPK